MGAGSVARARSAALPGGGATDPHNAANLLRAVRRGARGVVWYLKAILGEDAYEKYAAHHAARHAAALAADPSCAAHAVMTEREFWRDQTDRQDKNPQGRCC